MRDSCRSLLSVTALAWRLTARDRSYLVLFAIALVATVLGTIPMAPGLTADESHYLESGVSTLLLGGVLLILVVLPQVHLCGRGNWKEEALLALPVDACLLSMGVFLGFAAALAVYFLLAGGAYLAAAAIFSHAAPPERIARAVVSAFLLGLVSAAQLLLLVSVLARIPALVVTVLALAAGQISLFLPPGLALLLPPFDVLDPTLPLSDPAKGWGWLLARGLFQLGFYLLSIALVQTIRSGWGLNAEGLKRREEEGRAPG